MIFPSPIHAATWLSSTVDSSQIWKLFTRLFTTSNGFNLSDFDVDSKSGFFPPAPLPSLPGEYDVWEAAFAAAPSVIALAVDKSEEALLRRADGASWRSTIRSVRLFIPWTMWSFTPAS